MKISVNSMDFNGSLVNGPGVRSLLFLQGCSRHCTGCHNPSTWSPEGGVSYDVDDIVTKITEKCSNHKITITGGEPMEQMKALEELLEKLEGFDICLYTSYELGDIPGSILRHLSYVKTGPYVSSKRTTMVPFIGSTNQKFINLRG